MQNTIRNLLATGKKNPKPGTQHKHPVGPALRKALAEAASIKHSFLVRLARVHVLDPACGSGNFLYIALQKLKDLEKDVILFAGSEGVETSFFPALGPWQFHGIEINPYAHELAQLTLWIGYLQWHRGNGYPVKDSPLLKKLDNFHLQDSLLDRSDPANPREAHWPVARADREIIIVGNPPFLGGKMLRRELGDSYVDALFAVFGDRVPPEADLCCYWFEKARACVVRGHVARVGLLATQALRGGANREVLKRILADCEIFFAVSDRDWILDGANVHISMVGFHKREESAVIVFARSDDFFFGMLHSRIHEVWSRAQGTQLREKESGFRYTPTTCFETFPFPWDPRRDPAELEAGQAVAWSAISGAARNLDTLRNRWLNPPEWTREDVLEFPASETGPWRHGRDPQTGLARLVCAVPRDSECASRLAARTLTKLYNARPAWLAEAHSALDAAVVAAYRWPADLPEAEILPRLLALHPAMPG